MTQIVASYRSVEADVTSYQAALQRQNLSLNITGKKPKDENLSPQAQQIVDDVGISQEALDKLKEAQKLADYLQSYLDYLKGRGKTPPARIIPPQEGSGPRVEISGQSTNLAASVTVGSIRAETLEVTATLDDNGNISELSITKTSTTIEFAQIDITRQDQQFYASIG